MDNVQCPTCGSRRTEWTQDRVRMCWVIVCVDCDHHFPPPPRAQIARTVADVERAVRDKPWHADK